MATSQKSRDREKCLSFPTKNKKISRCHIVSRDYPFILTFQQIPCNQKENHLKFKRKFEMPVFWDPPTFFRKDGDIAGDGTGGGGVPVRLEESPDHWKLAHRDWQRVRISNFLWEIYLVRECIKLICCVMYCFKILEKEKKTKTAFWYLWVSWVWTRVLRSSTLCLSMFIYVWFCQDPTQKGSLSEASPAIA